jgi:AraC-like DNA-binding protein
LNRITPPHSPDVDVELTRPGLCTSEQVPLEVLNCLKFVHRHLFDRQLTVSRVKQNCNVNGSSLSAAFKYYVGRTPKKYINLCRVDAAARLLQQAELAETNLSHIAAHLGYRRPSTFSKAFKRVTGCPPGDWSP